MPNSISSRERMLATIGHGKTDHTPCNFMLFTVLRDHCIDQTEFVERQIDMGLDTCMRLPVRDMTHDRSKPEQGDLHRLPVRFRDNVGVKDRCQGEPGERYPILHRQNTPPAGILTTSVDKTRDWVQGDRVSHFDDFLIPHARQRLITGPGDLPALRCLLTPPIHDEIAEFQQTLHRARATASKLELMTVGEWSGPFDIAYWFCRMEALTFGAKRSVISTSSFTLLLEDYVETGTPDDVRQTMVEAMHLLGADGGFVLLPVDNVVDDGPGARAKVDAFVEAWRQLL